MQKVTINLRGIDLTVCGYYSPEEPQVMYYSDGSGYPGCSAEFEIHEITLSDSIINLVEFLDRELIEIEELCITELNN